MKNINIISTHATLESAIEAAGGLNRDYNQGEFDKQVARTKAGAAKNVFYVIENYGKKVVLYHYNCDIRLLNGFSPFSAGLSSSTQIGYLEGNEIFGVQCIDNSKANRKKVREIQKNKEDLYVLNF